jgi:uncharacterized protein
VTDPVSVFHLSPAGWTVAVLCGILVGISKTGLSGASILIVPLMAELFGGKPSAGLVVPMLVIGDIFGVFYYHRHAEWGHVLRLLPWTFCGITGGVVFGRMVSDRQFTMMVGAITLISITIMFVQELRRSGSETVPQRRWFSALMGLAGGFATMVGNAAGPVMAVYLLSMRLPKNVYIGTGAWFFFIVNLSKIPLHLFFWNTITPATMLFDLLLIPAIAAGAVLGFHAVKFIPERPYRIVIMVMTAMASVKLFW